jgi:hypothetical protein
MRYELAIAIFTSVLVHVFLIANLTFPINTNLSKQDIDLRKPNLSAGVLQVRFSSLVRPKLLRLQTRPEATKDTDDSVDVNVLSKNRLTNQTETSKTVLTLPLSNAIENTDASGNGNPLNQYLKPSDVDIRAIPLHGIEPPRQSSNSKLLVVYQLRIFIDKSGNVNQVVNLDRNNSEPLFYSEIVNQVKKLMFIPAKKNGVAVDSYVEVVLEA